MRFLLPTLFVLLPLLSSPASADLWKEDAITAGEVDVHSIWNPGCHLLWFWTLTFTLVDPAVGDSVAVALETTDTWFVGGGVATWTAPTVVVRGSGPICALAVEVAGLTVVGARSYLLDFEISTLQDQ